MYEIKYPNSDDYVVKLKSGACDFFNQVSLMFELSVHHRYSRSPGYAHKVVDGGRSKL